MEPFFEQLAEDHAGHSNLRIAKFQADTEDARPFAEAELGLKTFPTIVLLPKNGAGYIKYPSERRDPTTMSLWLQTVVSS